MPSKYKHIKLPHQLYGSPTSYSSNRSRRIIQHLPGFPNQTQHKAQLSSELNTTSSYVSIVQPSRRLDSDKQYADIKIKFQGLVNRALLDKYNISVYTQFDDKPPEQEYPNGTIYGKVRVAKLPRQRYSDFEQLELGLSNYIRHDALKSYFEFVEELAPLSPETVVSDEVREKLSGTNKIFLDVIFGDSKETSAAKFEDIENLLAQDFVTSINTDLVHYCRLHINQSGLEQIMTSYAGILGVEESITVIFGSGSASNLNNFTIDNQSGGRPILILDHAVDLSHPLLGPVSEAQVGESFSTASQPHGTQVASLVIYGSKLNSGGNLIALNRVLPINIFPVKNGTPQFDENLIIQALQQNASTNNVLIANLSVNDYTMGYNRKTVHRLTVLLDELAVEHNCIIVISAGNLFTNWPSSLRDHFTASLGYPNYFSEPDTCVLPPADSINNITVGSITYQAGPNSITPVKEPSPISRKGFLDTKGFCVIKPDLVNYDSNFDTSYRSEDNGPFMANPGGNLTRNAGTSFSAPLIAHELALIAKEYPNYTANSLKALLIHFAEKVTPTIQITPDVSRSLVGHGMPDIDRALYSINTSSTLVIEDKIKVNTRKAVRIPIPPGLAGSNNKRLRVRKTLVYNPKVNNTDPNTYNPVLISAKIVREDGQDMDNATSQRYLDGAHRRSNVKTYNNIERSTRDHTGAFWTVEITAEPVNDSVPPDVEQDYSLIVTIEDIDKDDSVNLHQEIEQMIEVAVGVDVNIELVT